MSVFVLAMWMMNVRDEMGQSVGVFGVKMDQLVCSLCHPWDDGSLLLLVHLSV